MSFKENIIGIFFSVLLALIFWKILIVPTGIFVAVIISVLFFFTFKFLADDKENSPIAFRLSDRNFNFLFVFFIIVCEIGVYLISGLEGNSLFTTWSEIPPPNLIRLLFSAVLVIFAPGYLLLSLIDIGGTIKGLEKILVSVLISVFVLPFLGLLAFILGSSILRDGLYFVVLLDSFLLITFLFVNRKRRGDIQISFRLNNAIILSSLIVLVAAIIVFIKFSLNATWDYGDNEYYFGSAVSFTKDSMPVSVVGPGSQYPFWLFIFVAQGFSSFGIPYANAFQFLLVVLSFLPIVSFYVMLSGFFGVSKLSKIPIVGTILCFFGMGFGWLYTGNVLEKTQFVSGLYNIFENAALTDSGYLSPPIAPLYTLLLFYFALSIFFVLIWVVYSQRGSQIGKVRYVLVALLVALGYLSYISLSIIFIIIFLFSILIYDALRISEYRWYALSIVSGLLLVVLVDFILQSPRYTSQDVLLYGIPFFYPVFGAAVGGVVASLLKGHLPKIKGIRIRKSLIEPLKLIFLSLFAYLYFLCFIILDQVLKIYSNVPNDVHNIPWYAWPVRLGVVGILSLPAIAYLIFRGGNLRRYTFWIFFVFVSFGICVLFNLYPVYVPDRLAFLVFFPVVVLSSYFLVKFVEKINEGILRSYRKLIIASTLLAILVMGFLPPLLSEEAIDYNYWANGNNISNLELEAYNFLRLNTPSNSCVLTLTSRSNYLLSYAGLSDMQNRLNRDPELFTDPVFPETAIYSLMVDQVKFIYLSSADIEELKYSSEYSGFLKDVLLKYLPIAFQNSAATVFQIPHFSLPSESSSALVVPDISVGYYQNQFERNLANSNHSSILGSGDVITIKSDNSTYYHDYKLSVNVDCYSYPYLSLQYQTNGNWTYLCLVGTAKTYFVPLAKSENWQSKTINLKNFYDSNENKTISVGPNELIGQVIFRSSEADSVLSVDSIRFAGFSNISSERYFFDLSAMSLSQSSFSIVNENDPQKFNYSTLVVSRNLSLLDAGDQQDFQEYMNWVNSGGNLVVLDNSGEWLIADNASSKIKDEFKINPLTNLLSLRFDGVEIANVLESAGGSSTFESLPVPILNSNDPTVNVTGTFSFNNRAISGFAFTKSYGKGKISYAFVSSYFLAMENLGGNISRELFEQSGSLIDALNIKPKKIVSTWTNYVPQFEFVKSPIELVGDINIKTNYFNFMSNPNTLAIYSSDNNISNLGVANIHYSGSNIEFSVEATNVNSNTLSYGTYSSISIIGGFNLTLKIPENSLVEISYLANGNRLVNSHRNCTVKLFLDSSPNSTFVALKNPQIAIDGTSYFGKARLYESEYIQPLFYDDGWYPFKIVGKTSFSVSVSDFNEYFVDDFTFNGNGFVPPSEVKQPVFTEFTIPWLNVIQTPANLIVIAVLITVFVIFLLRNRINNIVEFKLKKKFWLVKRG